MCLISITVNKTDSIITLLRNKVFWLESRLGYTAHICI